MEDDAFWNIQLKHGNRYKDNRQETQTTFGISCPIYSLFSFFLTYFAMYAIYTMIFAEGRNHYHHHH